MLQGLNGARVWSKFTEAILDYDDLVSKQSMDRGKVGELLLP